MNNKSIIFRIIFLCEVFISAYALIVGFEFMDKTINVLGITWNLYDIVLIAAIFFVAFYFFSEMQTEETKNRIIFFTIILYILYQIIVLAPLTYLDPSSSLSINNILREVVKRSCFILVPFFVWFVLPAFKSISTVIKIINYSVIIVILFGIYQVVTQAELSLTNTGQTRVLSGITAPAFIFLLVTSYSFFGASKSNYLFIIASLVGLIFTGHRSAFLAGGLIVMVNFVIMSGKLDFKRILSVVLPMLLSILIITQIPFLVENLQGRSSSMFDTQDSNALIRFQMWDNAWDYFLENPINGSLLKGQYYKVMYYLVIQAEPHNFILELLAKEGIIGTLWHFIILGMALKIAYKNKGDSYSRQMLIIMIFYLFFALLNVTYTSLYTFFFLMVPMAIILYQNKILKGQTQEIFVHN